MSLPRVASREEWRAARVELLSEEKAMTRARDALSARRRNLPMVEIDKDYRFVGPGGPVGLADPLATAASFLREGDRVFHTYSIYARGTEMLGGSYYFLDLTALGRQEDWEEPKGRATGPRAAVPNFEG